MDPGMRAHQELAQVWMAPKYPYIWGYIGIMEKKMEATIVHLGLYRDNGKENGNCDP